MKKHSFSLILLLLVFVSSYSQTAPAKKQIGGTRAPLRFSLIHTTTGGKIALLGKHSAGVSVAFLNLSRNSIFSCRTALVKSETSEFGDKVTYTTLDKQPPNSELENLSNTVVLNGTGTDYEIIRTVRNTDQASIKSIDRSIRDGNFLGKLIRQNAELTPVKEYLAKLKKRLPMAYDLPISDKAIRLFEYTGFIDAETIGPRFLVINSKIFPLSGQCSGKLLIFRFDGRYFINSASNCCECGLNAQETFEIRANTVIKIFSDYSYSD